MLTAEEKIYLCGQDYPAEPGICTVCGQYHKGEHMLPHKCPACWAKEWETPVM